MVDRPARLPEGRGQVRMSGVQQALRAPPQHGAAPPQVSGLLLLAVPAVRQDVLPQGLLSGPRDSTSPGGTGPKFSSWMQSSVVADPMCTAYLQVPPQPTTCFFNRTEESHIVVGGLVDDILVKSDFFKYHERYSTYNIVSCVFKSQDGDAVFILFLVIKGENCFSFKIFGL